MSELRETVFSSFFSFAVASIAREVSVSEQLLFPIADQSRKKGCTRSKIDVNQVVQ
jgi:hypothetical protein